MKALKLTPNLVVCDVTDSLNFYRDVLGFERAFSVPEAPPYVFAACGGGGVEIFFNDKNVVGEDYPALAANIGGSFTMFIEVDDLKAVLANVERQKSRIKKLFCSHIFPSFTREPKSERLWGRRRRRRACEFHDRAGHTQ